MNDMRAVIIPKSDQINADDLLANSMTITITAVSIRPGTEQPVTINFDGDGGKPYKPCKSMARVMVSCWGPDANEYVGRSMTLYCDPKVLWGGMAVGGIRISHMTHIDAAHTMALTATKGSKKPFTVKPLVIQPPAPRRTSRQFLDELQIDMEAAMASTDPRSAFDAIMTREDVKKAETALTNGAKERFENIVQTAVAQLAEADEQPIES